MKGLLIGAGVVGLGLIVGLTAGPSTIGWLVGVIAVVLAYEHWQSRRVG